MNEESVRRWMEGLRDRYFRPTIRHPEGDLVHFGDCETHRAMEVYRYAPCTCGLLCDLRRRTGLGGLLRPEYGDDIARQEAMVPGAYYWMSDEERAAARKAVDDGTASQAPAWLRAALAAPSVPPPESTWVMIGEVFGPAFRDRKRQAFEAAVTSAGELRAGG